MEYFRLRRSDRERTKSLWNRRVRLSPKYHLLRSRGSRRRECNRRDRPPVRQTFALDRLHCALLRDPHEYQGRVRTSRDLHLRAAGRQGSPHETPPTDAGPTRHEGDSERETGSWVSARACSRCQAPRSAASAQSAAYHASFRSASPASEPTAFVPPNPPAPSSPSFAGSRRTSSATSRPPPPPGAPSGHLGVRGIGLGAAPIRIP